MKELRLKLPVELLKSFINDTSSHYCCKGQSGNQFCVNTTINDSNVEILFLGDFLHRNTVEFAEYCPENGATMEYSPELKFSYSNQANCNFKKTNIQTFLNEEIGGTSLKDSSSELETSVSSSVPVADTFIKNLSFGDLSAFGTLENGQWHCRQCPRVFKSRRRFVCHGDLQHEGFKFWSCVECDFSTSFSSSLMRHVRREHNSTEPTNSASSSDSQFQDTDHSLQDDSIENVDTQNISRVDLNTNKSTSELAQVPNTELPVPNQTETQTISVEIEVRRAKKRRPARSGVLENVRKRFRLIGQESVDDTGDNGSKTEESNKVRSVVNDSSQIVNPFPDDLDPRLRKIGRNYQLVIYEYCSIVDDEFMCNLCDSMFRKRVTFMNHLYTQHSECQPYFCLLCDFRTRGKSNVFTHNSHMHTGKQKPYKCSQCDMEFLALSKLEDHVDRKHNSGNIIYDCPVCEETFCSKHERREHIKSMHSAKTRYACSTCGKEFCSSQALKLHSNVHVPGRRYKCTYCQKLYRSEQSLRIHMHSHTTVFRCQICEKNIYSYSAFVVHKNMHDPKAKKHACTVCGKLFPNRKVRDRHTIVKHAESKVEFNCDKCSKTFKLHEQLLSHMVCHSNDTPWVCDICGKSFKRQSSLCTHQKTHGNLKKAPFICAFCQTEFKSYELLAEHLTHVEKAGLCTICYRLFSSKPLLDQHTASAHRQQQSILEQYLTQPIETVQERDLTITKRQLNERNVERVTIVGPSLITYDEHGKPNLQGFETNIIPKSEPVTEETKPVVGNNKSGEFVHISPGLTGGNITVKTIPTSSPAATNVLPGITTNKATTAVILPK